MLILLVIWGIRKDITDVHPAVNIRTSNAMAKIDHRNLIRAFDIAREKADIQNYHFRDLRHTYATRLAQRGIDLYKISKLLGHCEFT